jgi:ribosome-associated protein
MPAVADIVIRGPRPLVIPAEALDWQFVRSSGPGGQHVNRTSSKAILRFDLRHTPHLPGDVRQRMLAALRPRLTTDGWLLIASQQHRDRGRNIADCRAKLAALVERALVPPKVRRRTKTPRSAIANRLETKKRRGATKRLRWQPPD